MLKPLVQLALFQSPTPTSKLIYSGVSHAATAAEIMNLLILKHGKQEAQFVRLVRGCVGLPAALQIECGRNFLFNAEEVVHIWGDGVPVKVIVEISAMLAYHVLQPAVVVLLMEISR
jgi:hypothetical protein